MRMLVLLAPLVFLSSTMPDLPKDRVARLKKGEVVVATSVPDGSNVVYVVAEGVVDAPPADVWAHLEACAGYAGKMPRIAASKELSRKVTPTGEVVRCELTADMPFPLPNLTSTTEAVHKVTGERRERVWTLVEGDYHQNAGRWVVEPFDGDAARTLAHYELALELKMPAPKSLVEAAQARTIPQIFEALRVHTRKTKP